MIKILHFITDSNVGGAGILLCQQIACLDTEKFNIFVALPKGSALIKRLKPLPCQIIQFKHGADKSFTFIGIAESKKIIKKVCPDIVHSHGSLSSRIAATLLKIPRRIFTRHTSPPISKIVKAPLIKRCYGTINALLSTQIIATAEYVKRDLINMGCDEQKIRTVINGTAPLRLLNIDEKTFYRKKYGINENDFVISIVARIEKGKGHQTLIEAAKICKNEHQNFRFLIVGSGSLEEKLKNYVRAQELEGIVRFIGFCNDVAPIFNLTDVNVNCSYLSETSSLSLSEGMSIGIPCVVSDIGGNPYMVRNNENGLIFPAKDSEALASALIRLYQNKKLYKKCSLGALKRYQEELNDKIMCKKMTDFYINEYNESKARRIN